MPEISATDLDRARHEHRVAEALQIFSVWGEPVPKRKPKLVLPECRALVQRLVRAGQITIAESGAKPEAGKRR